MRDKDVRLKIARRAAELIRDGDVVNLGVGIPTLVADVMGSRSLFFHSENGILGFGPPPPAGLEDIDLVDAGKRPVTEIPGVVYFDSAESFGMIRGGHLDCAIIGVLQVDQEGGIANWRVPGKPVLGVGGAMDLLTGARRVILTTTLTDSEGHPKLLKRCTFPITAHREEFTLVTEKAVFSYNCGLLTLEEHQYDTSVAELRDLVEAEFSVSSDLRVASA